VKQFIKDLLIGAAIAAPVYWMFTKLLAINLPGLTSTGWV
jgi:putative tricarboxylic transport membrane protein